MSEPWTTMPSKDLQVLERELDALRCGYRLARDAMAALEAENARLRHYLGLMAAGDVAREALDEETP